MYLYFFLAVAASATFFASARDYQRENAKEYIYQFLETYLQPAFLSSSQRPSPSRVASQILTCCCLSSAKVRQISACIQRIKCCLLQSSHLFSHFLLISLTGLVPLISPSHPENLQGVLDSKKSCRSSIACVATL
jgi:hypothetical protein